MKANEIVDALEKLPSSKYKRILINGSWGVGKTKYIEEHTKNNPDKYCYISLFGKKSTEDIINEIYGILASKTKSGTTNKFFENVFKKMEGQQITVGGFGMTVPPITNVMESFNKQLKGSKNIFTIIFDDLERKHDDLNTVEVLGLIDSMTRFDKIKSILVCDASRINNEVFLINTKKKRLTESI